MAEESLAPAHEKPGKWPLWRTLAAIGLVLVVAILLARQPIGEAVGRAWCAGQGLKCTLKITRLDLGGLTLKQLTVKGPSANTPPLTADQLAVNLSWANPFSPRPTMVGGKGIRLLLDLTGHQPVLGDLDPTVQKFASQPPGGGPSPKIDLQNITLVANTPLGPVEAKGQLEMTGLDDLTLHLAAAPIKLSGPAAAMDLRSFQVDAKTSGATITGKATLDLKQFTAPGATIQDVKLDLDVNQADGVLKGQGAASAGEVSLKQGGVKGASLGADVEAAAIDLNKPPGSWLAAMRKLTLTGKSGAGSLFGAAWQDSDLNANLDPQSGGGASGDLSFVMNRLSHEKGAAEKLGVDGKLNLPAGFERASALQATGVARLVGAQLTKAGSEALGGAVETPLKDVAPNFSAAAARVLKQAGQSFDVSAPWSAEASEAGFAAALLGGATVKAKSGLALTLNGAGQAPVAAWSSDAAKGWTAAGTLLLSGGGGPHLALTLAGASGSTGKISASGAVEMQPWRVGEDTLAAKVSGLSFETAAGKAAGQDTGQNTGKAAGEVLLTTSGSLAGGIWTNLKASGAVTATWSPGAFAADAPRGLNVSWDKAAYGDTTFGAAALRYQPKGRLAELRGDAMAGDGTLGALNLPVSGKDYKAHAVLGATAVNWTSAKTVKVAFNTTAPSFTFDDPDAPAPVPTSAGSLSGTAELADGWRITGALNGAVVKTGQVSLAGIKAKLDLAGKAGGLSGSLANVEMAISDPQPKAKQLFEPETFSGSAKLANDVATFSGTFTLAKSGVQVASVTGQHNLKSSAGSLTFAPTPLLFRENGFQPSALSRLLIGPANVTGRVDISGGATWTAKDFNSTALVSLRKVGFVLASAGEFAGVSGDVEIADVLNMKSAPHQTITLDKVTLGLPIENGVIHFQLAGSDAIKIEGAEWPFAGGFLRIQPATFSFSAASNRIVAEAVDWSLASIIEMVKPPDLTATGKVNGTVPVLFSTGSAKIDHAALKSSPEGGVIHYTGSTGDAASQSNSSAKLLFDALKDFRYKELELDVDGDIAGRLTLQTRLEGLNPAVLSGAAFKTRISIDGPLVDLLNTTSQGNPTVNAIVDKVSAGAVN